MKSRMFAVALLSLIALASARAEIIEQILVKVNGEIFTKSDLEQRQIATLRQKGQQFDLKGDPSNQQLRKALDEITPGIMVDAIDEMLIVQRGKELGYKLSDEQLRAKTAEFRERLRPVVETLDARKKEIPRDEGAVKDTIKPTACAVAAAPAAT